MGRVGWACPLLAATLLLAACEHAPDLAAARARAAEPVQRYDTIQALAGDATLVVAGTQSGAVLRSTDQGTRWTRTALAGASLIGLERCRDGSFIALDFYHRVWSAPADAGRWTAHALKDPANPLAIHCDPLGRWWVAGSRATLAVSADQGESWQLTSLKEDTQITTLQFVDARHGFALGEFGTVLESGDGGASWQRLAKIEGDFYPYAAWFRDGREGYASGLAGTMLATHDGGHHWVREDNASGAALYRLFVHGDEVWAAGANGTLARHAGAGWVAVARPQGSPAPLFAATSAGSVVLSGGPGGLLQVVHPTTQQGS
ncbi:MAG: glycosyl hydrolase [Pseudomonadota bacterium]|nr:glycosyl hydrolase [Pseudomonadota bacterium]